jgi:sulfofructose kinase
MKEDSEGIRDAGASQPGFPKPECPESAQDMTGPVKPGRERSERQRTEVRPGALDVTGVGYTCMDFLATVPGMPAINTKMEMEAFHIQGGGPTATAMVTLARLGASTALIAKIGDDLSGQAALSELKKEDINLAGVVIQEGASSQCAFILVDGPTGKRTIFWTRGSLDQLAPSEIDAGLVLSARYLLIDDLEPEAAAAAASLANKASIPVVLDAGSTRAGVEKLVPLSTHLVTSEDFPREFTGKSDLHEAAASLLEMGPSVVTVTLGERGCFAMQKGKPPLYQRGFQVRAVDTTGAGDVFHGAYIRALLEDWELPRVLEFACAVAGLKCTKPGGRTGIPTMGQSLAFLGW